jgi:hypothetical protein
MKDVVSLNVKMDPASLDSFTQRGSQLSPEQAFFPPPPVGLSLSDVSLYTHATQGTPDRLNRPEYTSDADTNMYHLYDLSQPGFTSSQGQPHMYASKGGRESADARTVGQRDPNPKPSPDPRTVGQRDLSSLLHPSIRGASAASTASTASTDMYADRLISASGATAENDPLEEFRRILYADYTYPSNASDAKYFRDAGMSGGMSGSEPNQFW